MLRDAVSKPLSVEMSRAELGDIRLNERLGAMSDALARKPEASFPQAMRSDAELEAAYRLMRNPRISWEKILNPHIEATVKRAEQIETVLMIHDTTDFEFPGDAIRSDLGRLRGNKSQGFFGHFSLAVAKEGGVALPLGVANLIPSRRLGTVKGKRTARAKREDTAKESLRWHQAVLATQAHFKAKEKLIHIMDREADSYALFVPMIEGRNRFVIRIAHDRRLSGTGTEKLYDIVDKVLPVFEREVPISARKKSPFVKKTKIHPPRQSRIAKLAFSATTVEIERAGHTLTTLPKSVRLNVVRVFEVETPQDCVPVEWKLVTTEPVDSAEAIASIVDTYRTRWLIEEYFKAIKTGCGYEKRQLESFTTLINALAIIIPIAWRLLLIRNLGRLAPSHSGKIAMNKTQVQILRAASKRTVPENPTIEEIMMALAALGGHIKNNGLPGWQVLGRGYQEFLMFEAGWMAATRSDM